MKKLMLILALLAPSVATAGETVVLKYDAPLCVSKDVPNTASQADLARVTGTKRAPGCSWVKKGTSVDILAHDDQLATVRIRGRTMYMQTIELHLP